MKKRILSILLLCCMVLGLLPTTVFANNDGTKAIQLGTSGISGYDSTNNSYDYIYFGTWDNSTVKWRVLDTKTNMPNAQEEDGFFLLSDALLGTGEYGGVEFDYTTPYFNDWKGSRAQDWCNDFYSRSLSITEQKAVLATSKSDALYGMYYAASDNILDGDKVFFLSAEEAENAAYGFTDDNARIANYGDSAYIWWLRSPRRMNPDSAGTVNEKGAVIGEWVGQTNAARPAFNLKPDSVLLVSAAVGGKGTADGMFKIPEYSGDEWKLTLLDDTRTFRVTETTAAGKPGGTVTLNFSGPRTGQNEYISAIIEGKNGATHYGRIMKPTAADRQLSFTLPHDLASGNYKLHVFSEQYNGDCQTDYASQFQTVALTVEEAATEQFALTPGGTYYFDLSGENIPGTINDDLPDKSMHYVPFTYAGTVDAYKLTSEMVTTEEYAQKNEYVHSLFVADYVVTHTVGWDNLDGASLIFGKGYAAGSVDYMLRAPSTGSDGTGSGNSRRGTPQSNEWDRILDKDDGYIKNCGEVLSWGQDTASSLLANRARRGNNSARNWSDWNATWSRPVIGFRPVLEVLNPDTLSSDGLKVVTLDLGGGKLGGSSDAIHIIVKTGSTFTAPASDGLTRPDGDAGSFFMWLGSDGKLYDPGDNVPADVTKLTAQFASSSHSVTITTATLPDGKVGEAYSQTLIATGTTPITWSIIGALPDGLSLNKDTGKISGTPTAAGSSTFTVKATNSAGSDTKELSITITKDAPPAHEHSYGDWRKDGTSHWHECTDDDCPNREESINDKAAHVYDDDADTTCDVCGYERTVTPPSHEHSYGDWRKDGTNHWHECTDADCPNREESIKDKAAHVYTDDTDTICDVCGYKRTVTPPAHEHNYGDWSKDGTSHWHECTDADCPNREESINDKAAHVYDDDADTTCNVCGYERTVAPPAPTEFIVTFDGNGGTPSVDSMTTTNQKLTSLPSASRSGSYSFDGWYTEKSGGTKITTDTVFHAGTTVYAHWTYTGGGSSNYSYYTIKATAGTGGSITPSGNVSVREGGDKTFTITPDKGYTVSNVKIDGRSIGAVKSYTFENVKRAHTIEVSFTRANEFIDVPAGSYYDDAVLWAVENGITTGASASRFDPNGICTRAQAVTFLWRAAGSPKPETRTMPFTDVPVGSYCYDAVLWAVENGITKGTSDTTFSPNDTCTRAQIVSFLWRSEKTPVASSRNPFTDVKPGAYYLDAVLWVVESGITKGTTAMKFSPDADCTRAQIVTFLWRCKK